MNDLNTQSKMQALDLELKQIEVDTAKAKLRQAVAFAEIKEREARGVRPLKPAAVAPAGPPASKGAEQ